MRNREGSFERSEGGLPGPLLRVHRLAPLLREGVRSPRQPPLVDGGMVTLTPEEYRDGARRIREQIINTTTGISLD